MARVVYSKDAFSDLERITDFLRETEPQSVMAVLDSIRAAVSVLAAHPLIGRRRDAYRRELIIARGKAGYMALYRFDAAFDVVRVLRIRHQREVGYRE